MNDDNNTVVGVGGIAAPDEDDQPMSAEEISAWSARVDARNSKRQQERDTRKRRRATRESRRRNRR